jgi:hypothetical protein
MTNKIEEYEYCKCSKPTLGVNTWTCGCGKPFNKTKMDIQKEIQEIHSKYGTTEVANYKIQLFIEELINEQVIEELEKLVNLKQRDCNFHQMDHTDEELVVDVDAITDRIKELKQD